MGARWRATPAKGARSAVFFFVFFSLSHPYSSLVCAVMVVCDSYRAQPGRAALKMKKELGGRCT